MSGGDTSTSDVDFPPTPADLTEPNSTTLIKNILPLVSKFSNAPEEKLKELISTEVLTIIKRKYANFEFETEFDENGIFHLKHDNFDFFTRAINWRPD